MLKQVMVVVPPNPLIFAENLEHCVRKIITQKLYEICDGIQIMLEYKEVIKESESQGEITRCWANGLNMKLNLITRLGENDLVMIRVQAKVSDPYMLTHTKDGIIKQTSLANSNRLELPPVNFYAIASRYLRQLSLLVETILPHACRIYEWSMPSELWLSANEFRLPTHSFVLSILIVAIRILYNIHGLDEEAEFECNVDVNSGAELSSLSNNRDISEPCTSSQSGVSYTGPYNELPKQSNLDATDILHVLHSKYNKLIDTSDHGKDLEKYLEYCKDVVFAEVELSFEDHEEDKLMKDIWDFYQKKKEPYNNMPNSAEAGYGEEHKPSDTLFSSPSCSPHKRPRDLSKIKTNRIKKPKTGNVSKGSHEERAIQRMILNME
ncbi:TATA box-binding protein-associated factor RNA polymerase I subunit B isoform X1, partial [Tanacetum coccineum]